jgi:TPR repeat protein
MEANMKRDEHGQIDERLRHVEGDGKEFYELGLMYTVGSSVPVDFVSAHKWLNLAAMAGNAEAIRLRHEIAAEMSKSEITTAQRAARDWLTRH